MLFVFSISPTVQVKPFRVESLEVSAMRSFETKTKNYLLMSEDQKCLGYLKTPEGEMGCFGENENDQHKRYFFYFNAKNEMKEYLYTDFEEMLNNCRADYDGLCKAMRETIEFLNKPEYDCDFVAANLKLLSKKVSAELVGKINTTQNYADLSDPLRYEIVKVKNHISDLATFIGTVQRLESLNENTVSPKLEMFLEKKHRPYKNSPESAAKKEEEVSAFSLEGISSGEIAQQIIKRRNSHLMTTVEDNAPWKNDSEKGKVEPMGE